jgi:hypothetical protein
MLPISNLWDDDHKKLWTDTGRSIPYPAIPFRGIDFDEEREFQPDFSPTG